MRRILVALPLLLLLLAGCGAAAPAAEPPPSTDPPTHEAVVGEWTGQIEIPGSPLDVGIRVIPDGDALRGEIDIPVQGITAKALQDVALEGATLTFAIPDVPGDPRFSGTVSDGSIDGEFTQAGQSFPLVLHPGAAEEPARPQEPQPPFPYRTEEVSYPSGDIELAGTLTLPEGDGPFTTVLLISGSGAQDRNEEMVGHKPFLVLADAMTRAGYAVLRVDDRGVGGSGGTLSESTYDDLTADVVAGVEFLRDRPEIDPSGIGLFGHSEGGYLAPLAAQRTDVAFVVSMAGPAVPGGEVLALQNRLIMEAGGQPPAVIEDQVAYVRELVDLLQAEDYAAVKELIRAQIEEQAANRPADQRPTPEQIEAQVQAQAAPYMRSFMTHDPTPSLQALDVPVLAFFGGKDLQVPATQNEPAMRKLLADNPDATVRTFPELNHLMQPATTGMPSEYAQIETTIDPQVLELVTGWLQERFPA